MKFLITISVLVIIYNSVLANSIYGLSGAEIEGIRNCYGVACPEGTVVCSKLSKSTEDMQFVDTIIKCEDNKDNALNINNQRTVNPFPGTQYSSFSYQGNYRIRLNARPLEMSERRIRKPIYDSNKDPTYYSKNNEVEEF
ncbi:uncharacterized protein LOC108737211 [Agrilus planipennis]|uniref:Uncharacterized protein LOC108737211 n=1 Tax=Agrilus planipennis TaxID=224129 RepID=A0A1W4WY45_AGRPL|nr:uncharacterized protein LOC108737211 [Agrilus planipennis]